MRFRREASADSGQSLVELLIGIAIAAIIVSSIVGAVVLSVRINKQSIAAKVASSLGQETLDDLRSISEGRWQRLYDLDTKDASSTYYIFNEDTVIAQDTISSAGTFSSLVLDSADNPVIAYYSAIDNLKVLHCNDDDCAGDDESIEIVDSGGFFNSIQLNGINPVIAHYNDTTDDFKIVRCNDPNCSSAVNGPESSELIDDRISGLSLQLDGSNHPVVSYQKTVGKNLYLLHCTDDDCSGAKSIEKVDGKGQTGDYTSLAISPSTGIPVIAYTNGTKLGVTRCNDVNCAGGDEIDNQVDETVKAEFISMQLDPRPGFLDYPVVSYFDAAPRNDLKILRCNDVSCLGGDESIVTVDTAGGESTSLQLDSLGNPVVSYIANDKLKILHCNDIYCLGGDESIIAVDDANPDANISGTSLRLDSLGNPVVSYYDDVNDDLKVLHCDDPNCDANVFTALGIASGTESIMIGGTAYTRWFSVENVNRDDVTGDIVEGGGPGTTEDSSTQKLTIHVEWQFSGDTANVSLVEFFTRSTRNTATVFTDWDGASGAEGTITDPTSNFSASAGIITSTSGQISLGSGGAGFSPEGVWIVFHEDFNNDLMAAEYVGDGSGSCTNSNWDCTTIDSASVSGKILGTTIDSNGTVWISYRQSDTLRVARNVPGAGCASANWTCEAVDSGSSNLGFYSSIAEAPDGTIWVSYAIASAGKTLKVARQFTGNPAVGGCSEDWECMIVDTSLSTDPYTAIAFDSAGTTWVGYRDESSESVKAARYVGGGAGGGCDAGAGLDWVCEIVDEPASAEIRFPAIAVDSNNQPWISYLELTVGDLRVAYRVQDGSGSGCSSATNPSDWVCVTVDDQGADVVGNVSGIAFDASGNAWISNRDLTNGRLKMARYVGGTSGSGCGSGSTAWTCTVVDADSTDTGKWTDIAFNGAGTAWVSYHDHTNESVRIAGYVGGGGGSGCTGGSADWTCITVHAPGGSFQAGEGTAIAITE